MEESDKSECYSYLSYKENRHMKYLFETNLYLKEVILIYKFGHVEFINEKLEQLDKSSRYKLLW